MNKDLKKTTLLIIFLLIFGLVFYFGYWRKVFQRATCPQKEGVIIAFGDSLVEGYGVEKNENFVFLLSQKTGNIILNKGKSGDTTESALARIKEDVLENNPRLVILLLGGNDFLKREKKEKVFTNLEKIIDQIKESGGEVILVGIKGNLFGNREIDRQFRDLSKKKKVFYVENVLEGIIGNPKLMFDAIHPNAKGHQKMAEKIYPVLEKALSCD